MKKLFAVVCALVLLGMNTTGYAETKKANKKSGRALEGTIQTRIGELKFEKGYPSDQTIDKLYNEMDFQRTTQANLWAIMEAGDFELIE